MMDASPKINKEIIIEKLAKEYSLTEKQVSDIVNSQWKFLASVMEKGEFDGVQIPRFGKFHVKLKRLQKLNLIKGLK